ncbi:MAG TPA: glycosyltransferase [Microbacteriaceae bacterium]|nr:glycosyltransferase [Microbacteriaceae bacterium]
MPSRVHAILVARDHAQHLRRTLTALKAQTTPPDMLTIVLLGRDEQVRAVAAESGADAVIAAPDGTSFAKAVGLAARRTSEGAHVWLLAQDTAPEPQALERLAGGLELAPSVWVTGPKLVRWHAPEKIVSLGVTLTTRGRAFEQAEGERDQGQHDGMSDVLGVDVRGVLVRAEAWSALAGPDPALAGADEGLDLGIRSRLAGGRVSVQPLARVAVAGDGVAGLPDPTHPGGRARRAYAERTALLHRRLTFARIVPLVLWWLAILPVALLRTVSLTVRKTPGKILPEWGAALTVLVRWGALHRSRQRVARTRTQSWAALAPLRMSEGELRREMALRSDEPAETEVDHTELRFFTGGGAWLVLAGVVVSVLVFTPLLAWTTLGGGALLPLNHTVAGLWAEAAYGIRHAGLGTIGAADPFAAVVALIGTFTWWAPSQAMVVLWVLALPLALLGGWFAATRVTDRAGLRIIAAIAWALAPTFLLSLQQGRPTGVIVHLLLPWLFAVGAVAFRSWGAAGAASLLLIAVLACAPVLALPLAVLWIVAIVLGRRGIARLLWLPVPALVVFAPLIWQRGFVEARWWGLLADPGAVWAGPRAGVDASARAAVAAGFADGGDAGWSAMFASLGWQGGTLVAFVLVAPLAVLALLSLLTPRIGAAAVLVGTALLGVGTALGATLLFVQAVGEESIALWPGAGASLAWLGAIGAAMVAVQGFGGTSWRPRLWWAAGIVAVSAIVLAAPTLASLARGESHLTNGPGSTLPAYVAVAGVDDPGTRTLVLTPQPDGGVAVRIVWGASETLGGQSTATSTARDASDADRHIAELAANLVAPSGADVAALLDESAVSFVLLVDGNSAGATEVLTDVARMRTLAAATAMDQAPGLVSVGSTSRGDLWRVEGVAPPAIGTAPNAAGTIVTVQLIAVAIAVLLALPTAASRRAGRRWPHLLVGPSSREGQA